jgi:DNA-binding transcriptional MerR regulator
VAVVIRQGGRLDIGAHSKVYRGNMTMTTGLRVADLAAACQVSPDTVRYYERAGLLPRPPRTAAGYRVYGPDAVDRLHFIRGAQRLGLRLREIRDLLAVRDTGECPCEPAEGLLRRRVDEVDAELARLTALRRELVTMATALPGADCPTGPVSGACDCPADPVPGTWCPPAVEGGETS